MGVKMYWIIVATVIILGQLMPQNGYKKKYYVILMACLHTFVCGFRYMYITGDLIKYSNGYNYYYENPDISWFSKNVFNGGRNAGFEWVKKAVAIITNGDFQIFLLVLAIIAEVGLAILVYRYSPKPWLSYLVWNCMGFFVTYDFCAIKQGLAMSILVFAMICILEKKPSGFLFFTLLAGFVHTPALTFLPAYWLMNRKVNMRTIATYIVVAGVIFIFRNNIVHFLQDIYYAGNDEVDFVLQSDGLGGRVVVILLIVAVGVILKGFQEKDFSGLFNIIIVAAIFQMFSVYDNVFTRLADYYLQFVVLYIPMIFYNADYEVSIDRNASRAILLFNERSMKLIVSCVVLILIWWYWKTQLGLTITYETDNYLNFRFMWDVVN